MIVSFEILQRIKLYFKNIATKIAITKCCKSISATNENIDLILRCKNIIIQLNLILWQKYYFSNTVPCFYSIVKHVYNLILENCKNMLRKYTVVTITIFMITHILEVAITETKKLIKTNHQIQLNRDLIKYFRELNLLLYQI